MQTMSYGFHIDWFVLIVAIQTLLHESMLMFYLFNYVKFIEQVSLQHRKNWNKRKSHA